MAGGTNNRLIAAYDQLLAAGTLAPDQAQAEAVVQLQRLAAAAELYLPASPLSLKNLLGWNGAPTPKGLYLHGAVGRGKTVLMDLFFRSLATRSKRRLHFDVFMAQAHAAIEHARAAGAGDPMPDAARQLAENGRLLCIDEFQVNDIADAMILSRLFERLFADGVVLVATSNTAPDKLYADGLNRPLFLPFVTRLKRHVAVLELAASKDYRLSKLIGRKLYFSPADAAAHAALSDAWTMLTGGATAAPRKLEVRGHRLDIPRSAEGTVWMTFDELCGRPLGAADYQALAASFHTLILEGIPVLKPENRNEARRLILLIDAIYDQRLRLIVSADAEPDALYAAGDGREAFRRTASRLVEMRSQDYLETSQASAGQRATVIA